jgi:hypothetical protein
VSRAERRQTAIDSGQAHEINACGLGQILFAGKIESPFLSRGQ